MALVPSNFMIVHNGLKIEVISAFGIRDRYDLIVNSEKLSSEKTLGLGGTFKLYGYYKLGNDTIKIEVEVQTGLILDSCYLLMSGQKEEMKKT